MRGVVLLGVLGFGLVARAQGGSVPAPMDGEWVVDRTGQVSPDTRRSLNEVAAALDATGAAQLGVLVVDSTSGAEPRAFAQGVFKSWNLGHAARRDGILLVIAVKDRRAEILLGDGSAVRSAQTDVVMRDLVVANMKEGDLRRALLEATWALDELARAAAGAPPPAPHEVFPRRKPVVPEGADPVLFPFADGAQAFPLEFGDEWVVDLGAGLGEAERATLNAVGHASAQEGRGVVYFLALRSTEFTPGLGTLLDRFVEQASPGWRAPVGVVAFDLNGPRVEVRLPPHLEGGSWERRQRLVVEERLAAGLEGPARAAAVARAGEFVRLALKGGVPAQEPPWVRLVNADDPLRQQVVWGLSIAFALFMFFSPALGVWLFQRWRRKVRHGGRSCPRCGRPMIRAGAQVKSRFLTRAQQLEDHLASVQHDVWWCKPCDHAVSIEYPTKLYGGLYAKCPACQARTLETKRKVIHAPSEDHQGLAEFDERCAHCGLARVERRPVPRLLPDVSLEAERRRSSSRGSRRSSGSSGSGPSSSGGSSSGGGGSGRGSSGSW